MALGRTFLTPSITSTSTKDMAKRKEPIAYFFRANDRDVRDDVRSLTGLPRFDGLLVTSRERE